MNPTVQAYTFETQEDFDNAVSFLGSFSTDQFSILASGGNEHLLHVWFADMATACVPFCEAIWPRPLETSD